MYIPMEWLKNTENEKEVHTLITECTGCFQFEGDSGRIGRIESRLKELGENKILEELKKGTFGQ